jgi:uncharacterized protein
LGCFSLSKDESDTGRRWNLFTENNHPKKMRTLFIIGTAFLVCLTAFAEPEIKGTIPDLAHFINDVPKSVVVTGEAEIRVPAHRAVLSLRVVTENKSLQEAMRANLEIRNKLSDYLKSMGIPTDRIQASKFSSTPKFGIFGEKAKSYRLENVMRISVQDEKEFQATSSAVDKWAEVQFDGVEFEYADKELQKQSAIAKACDNANDRKKVYEEKLGLKLTPQKFSEGEVEQRNAVGANYGLTKGVGYDNKMTPLTSAVVGSATSESVSSFGEMVYTARVSVEYKVQTK